MKDEWNNLFNEAKKVLSSKNILPFINYGSNACAIFSQDKIFTGISIDSNDNIGGCAESKAITNMLKDGKETIEKIVIINELEELIKPCHNCLSIINELSNGKAEILLSLNPLKIAKISELLPDWWGTYHQ